MNLNALISKLSRPYWMEVDPRSHIKALTPAHFGQLNIMWVLMDRKPITQMFFESGQGVINWQIAGQVSIAQVDKVEVREYATLFNEREFYEFVKTHKFLFGQYLPMSRWHKAFRQTRTQNG